MDRIKELECEVRALRQVQEAYDQSDRMFREQVVRLQRELMLHQECVDDFIKFGEEILPKLNSLVVSWKALKTKGEVKQ